MPLIVHAPGHFAPRRVAAAVSLVDVLPTLVEIAGDGRAGAYATAIEGRSLLPHLTAAAGHDEVMAEYLAEGAIAPVVMIRRGRHKFIHSPPDPDQLFDLSADPDERANLADRPEAASLAAHFCSEIGRRWDLEALDRAVRESQRRRHLVAGALAVGTPASWDYQPARDASMLYIRNHMALDDLEAKARFPRVAAPTSVA